MFKEKPRYAVVLRKEPARDPGAACDILEGGLALASGNERFVRRWPRSVWIWSPELGRWQPRYGRPRRTVCVEVSTSDVRPSEAFDYWRDIAYYHFDADPQPPGGRLQFRARASALMTAVGDLVLYDSRGVSGRRTARQIRADGGDSFAFGLVLAGVRRHRDEREGVTVSCPGEFFCYDATRVSRVQWEDHRGVHLSLPHDLVRGAAGRELPPAHELIQRMRQSHLAPFLCSHLELLAKSFDALSLTERTAILKVAVDLLLTILREALATDKKEQEGDFNAYFAAATQIIRDRLADPNLAAKSLASLLNLSRATLYRAFHERGLTVAGYIREVRLQEAKRRLESSTPDMPVAAIAEACGFPDPNHFRRLFRERFGMSPSEVRDAPRPPYEQHSLHT